MSKTILVVGAGPVGLSAAVALARSGTAVRIIDRLEKPTNQSRAAIVHARTLEHFQRLGLVDEFLQTGVRVFGVAAHGQGGILLNRASLEHLPTPFPYMLGLEQSETERILTARLREAGVEIDRGVELTGLDDLGDRVSVRLIKNGAESVEEYSYVLGADGARSAVRAALGFHLEGETLDATWITADVKIRWDRDPGEAVAFLSAEGIAFIAAMNDDRWRVIVNSRKLSLEEAQSLQLEDVQKLVDERCGASVPLYDPVWISPFAINTRVAPAMQKGRVFLAGDASHVHSPVGGQGMNTGIQDALNLAWKLSLVLSGAARPELLDTYNAERHANAQRLLRGVGPATKLANLRHPVAIEVRNHLVHLISQLGLNHGMPRIVSMLDVGCPKSPLNADALSCWFRRGPKPGDRAPNAEDLLVAGQAGTQSLFERWSGDSRHQLLIFGSDRTEVPDSPLYAVTRILREGVPAPDAVVDAHGNACDIYEASPGDWCLVRPDGIIAFRSDSPNPSGLRAYLDHWYHS